MPEPADDERARRRARREFVRGHHPDRGGDPAVFVAGLAALDHPRVRPARARVVVIPDRPWLVTLLTAVARQAGWRAPPPRVR